MTVYVIIYGIIALIGFVLFGGALFYLHDGTGSRRLNKTKLTFWHKVLAAVAMCLGCIVIVFGGIRAMDVVTYGSQSFQQTSFVKSVDVAPDGTVTLETNVWKVPCGNSMLCKSAHPGDAVRFTNYYSDAGKLDHTSFNDLGAFTRH